jgi:hypothetical protein
VKLEVRCCCQPEKLLGWIDAQPNRECVKLLKLAPLRWPWEMIETTQDTVEMIVLPIVRFVNESGYKYLAIKAEGRTMDELKQYRSFIPNERPA